MRNFGHLDSTISSQLAERASLVPTSDSTSSRAMGACLSKCENASLAADSQNEVEVKREREYLLFLIEEQWSR
jgi:hypothetical protein